MIINDIEKLNPNFKIKVKVFLAICRIKYPGLSPFETWRSADRQRRLYSNKKSGPVAKPGTSKHEKGLAVDWIFLDTKGRPTWKGDYKYLHYIGKMCGMIPVKGESCHLQDDGLVITSIMKENSASYMKSKSKIEQETLKSVNNEFRKFGYK